MVLISVVIKLSVSKSRDYQMKSLQFGNEALDAVPIEGITVQPKLFWLKIRVIISSSVIAY